MFGDSSIAGLFTSPTVQDFMASQQRQAAVPPPGTTFYDYVQQLIKDQPNYKYPDSMFGEKPAAKPLAPGFSAATPGSVESGGGGDSGAQVGAPGYVSNGPMGPGFTQGEVARGALQGFLKGGLSPMGGLLGGIGAYGQAQDFVGKAIDAYGDVYQDLGTSWGAAAPANGGWATAAPTMESAPSAWDSPAPSYDGGGGGGVDSIGGGYVGGDTGMGLI